VLFIVRIIVYICFQAMTSPCSPQRILPLLCMQGLCWAQVHLMPSISTKVRFGLYLQHDIIRCWFRIS